MQEEKIITYQIQRWQGRWTPIQTQIKSEESANRIMKHYRNAGMGSLRVRREVRKAKGKKTGE